MIEKPTLNAVFLGHVDSGKSTLAGRLLHSLGTINSNILDRVSNQSMNLGKGYFCYANLLSRTKQEMMIGRTIQIAHNRAETQHYYLNIIDAPATPFKKNMIRAISQANLGIIVVDAESGAYEAGIQSIREILVIAKCLGITQLIYCVNKLESKFVNNSQQDRFNEIQDEIARIAKRSGHLDEPLFIPISAWSDWNLTEPNEKLSWFNGPTLLDAINNLKPPIYHYDKPLRIPVLEVYNLKDVGTVIFGKVESGILTMETKLRFSNGKKKIADGIVGSIQIFNKPVTEAKAGQLVTIKLENVNYQDLHAGIIISDAENNPAKEVVSFEGKVLFVKNPNFKKNYKPTFHFYTLQTRCKFEKLFESIVGSGLVLFRPERPIFIEQYETFPPFGRFVIRDCGHVVAIGIVKKLNYADEN